MTDLEITKLCAEAMGWQHLGPVGVVLPTDVKYPSEADERFKGQLWCLSGGNDWWKNPSGETICGRCESIPDPLHDDAQAMALVKKMELSVYRMHGGEWRGWGVESKMFGPCLSRADNADLNRAICECVAKMRIQRGAK